MNTAVFSSTLNLPASNASGSSDSSRNTANDALNLKFSDLLRVQNNNAPPPPPTPAPSTPETPREVSRPAQASRPSQKPAQEPARTQDSPPATGPESPPPPDTETGNPVEEEKTPENIALPGNQQQHMDAAVPPDLPATIAALLNGIAGEPLKNTPNTETSTQAPTEHTSSRAATLIGSNVQPNMGMESNTDTDANTDSENAQPLPTNRLTKFGAEPMPQGQAATVSSGNESLARINIAAPDTIINTISSHENSSAPPHGTTPSAGETSMLNPLRLPTPASLPQFTIPPAAGQRAWAEEVGNRVMWMLGRAESRAELILTPPHLGKVEVSIHLNGDQSTAQFLASSQSAREALEQAMPRLRELLAQAGISLGEASVNTSAEDRAQNGQNTRHTNTLNSHDNSNDGDANVITTQNWSRLDSGIINVFA